MPARFLYIAVLLLMPLLGKAQSFDDMVPAMTPQSLPLVNVEVNVDSLNPTTFVPGTITIVEHKDGAASWQSYNCLARKRGKTARNLPKVSLAIKLVDEQGEKLDVNLLGLRNDNTWILDAMAIDKMRMRNRVCFDVWNEFSHTMWDTSFGNRNGTVGTMVEVFLNGSYNGIYHLSDKINRQLLNLRKAKVNSDSTVTIKGLLYKGAHKTLSNNLLDYEDDRTDTTLWNSFELQYPEDYPSLATWQPLMELIDFNGKTSVDYFKEHYTEWYYVDNLVDYFILLLAFGIDDMPYINTFLSTPDINFGHQFMISPWDLDSSLGRRGDGSPASPFVFLNHLNSYGPYNRIVAYNIDGFKNKTATRWKQLAQEVLSPAHVESRINAIAQRFVESGAWQREYERWKSFNEIATGPDLAQEVQYAMNWYNRTHMSLTDQFLRWEEGYVPGEDDSITSSTITKIYDYILGYNTTFDEKLDIDGDGIITVSDVTQAYNYLLQ